MKTKLYKFAAGLFLLAGTTASHAQLLRTFTPRYTDNLRGEMVFVANSIMASGRNVPADCGYASLPAADPVRTGAIPGSWSSDDKIKNDHYVGEYIDIDADPTTFNSSSANLTLPSCPTVAYAALYWGAGVAKNQGSGCAGTNSTPMAAVNNWNRIKFKAPGKNYVTVTAKHMDTISNIFQGYQGFADVTALVQAAGAGTYSVANVACPAGKVNTFGGWTLVVVYEDQTKAQRNFTIFDGSAMLGTSEGVLSSVDFTIKGFKAPPQGAVNARIGVVAYDGDRGAKDGFKVKDTLGNFVEQSETLESAAKSSSLEDVWNSTISNNGNNVNSRMPNYSNTFGYDSDVFDLANNKKRYIRNNDSVATLRLNTASEGYFLTVVATMVDNYQPNLLIEDTVVDLNGAGYKLGDTLLITSRIRNTGNDTGLNVLYHDKLEKGFIFVPGSISVDGIPQTDMLADDLAEYKSAEHVVLARMGSGADRLTAGTVKPLEGEFYTITYKLAISANCDDVPMLPAGLAHSSYIYFTGKNTGVADSSHSRPLPGAGGCLQPAAPRRLDVADACGVPLPLELYSFDVTLQHDNSAQLRWAADGDNELKYFIVEASADGRNFTELATIMPEGSAGRYDYTYADESNNGDARTYYRLAMVTTSGEKKYSKTEIVARRVAADAAAFIAPNPASTEFTVYMPLTGGNDQQAHLELYNSLGVLVRTIVTGNPQQVIPVDELAPGMYILQCQYNGTQQTFRVVKK